MEDSACQLAPAKVAQANEEEKEGQLALSRDFLIEYQKFVGEFDELANADAFQGQQLDRMAREFLSKHSDYMSAFAYSVETNYPANASNTAELLQEDVRIMASADAIPDYARPLGAVYQRASQAAYLRLTLLKARENTEEDRRVPVEFARQAIRFDPASFSTCLWFMIVLGWQLDGSTSTKDRIVGSKAFLGATKRCIELNPGDSLAHHLLGRYYYNVASLGWLERTLANNLLGGKLEGTYEQAEQAFRRSHELKDDWLPHGLWMARVLSAQKRPLSEVKKWIDYGLKMDCKEPTTELERQELLELQSRLKLTN